MPAALLQTKLFTPKVKSKIVSRPRLLQKLSSGTQGALTLITASPGSGKTTLLSDWIEEINPAVAWLSLDRGENDPGRFLAYVISSLQTIAEGLGDALLAMLLSPQPPDTESVLPPLLNEISLIDSDFVMVLDDYHVIDSTDVATIVAFLLENMPQQMHLIIATREDPDLPVARLRAGGQLTEIRVADLQFTIDEASEFLNSKAGLDISAADVARLEKRTEGWITGLQLAAISMQGLGDVSSFIDSFSGSHRFILDYLMEEVLGRQSEEIMAFLLQTSILNRLCGSLCDAVTRDDTASGQKILNRLEQSNLFLIPLDNERRWFRYHHLFADLLRQKLKTGAQSSRQGKLPKTHSLHLRASEWFEQNGLEIEALEYAAAANDTVRAMGLVEAGDVPLYFRGAAPNVLKWLETVSSTEMDKNPILWVIYASALLLAGQHTAVEKKLCAAEAVSDNQAAGDDSMDLAGRIAAIRATLGVIQNDAELIFTQSQLAKKYLGSGNRIFRTIAHWTSGFVFHLKGDRQAAASAYGEAIAIGCDSLYTTAATITLGQILESNNQLLQAAETYKEGIRLAGDPPHTIACEAFLGLARIHYEWNDLETASRYASRGLEMTRYTDSIDSFASYKIINARIGIAKDDWKAAESDLIEAEKYVRRNQFEFRMPQIAGMQILILLHKDNSEGANELAERYTLPLSLARVQLHRKDPSAALAILNPLRVQMEASGYQDELLRIIILQTLSHSANGSPDKAVDHLADAMHLAEQEGFIRSFLDEGREMAKLISNAVIQGIHPDYAEQLSAAFKSAMQSDGIDKGIAVPEILSARELEILELIAEGLKNREIGEKLFISLNTVLYHTKNIFGKLGVRNRTQAIAKARELRLM